MGESKTEAKRKQAWAPNKRIEQQAENDREEQRARAGDIRLSWVGYWPTVRVVGVGVGFEEPHLRLVF